jgi:hypothetical protein
MATPVQDYGGQHAVPYQDVPEALPVTEARQTQYGTGPMEAIPVEESAPAQGLQEQMPPNDQMPVQEPYSKQLWNK